MVNTSGLQRRSTYEEVMREVQLDNFKVKLPDRVATFTLEAPQLMALDPENEESIIAFEKRKRAENARKDQVAEVAQERGISHAQLELATRPSRGTLLEAPNDEFARMRYELGISQAVEAFATAHARAQNVERVRDMLRLGLHQTNRADPIARLAPDDTAFFDISTPPEHEIDLHLPAVPERRVVPAGGILNTVGDFAGGLTGTAHLIARTAGPPAVNALAQVLHMTASYGPGLAMATIEATGLFGRGLAAGGQAAGRAALAAGHVLASTTPASHRGRDFTESVGIRVGRHQLNVARQLFG
jgi:hypothetical protein